MSWFVLCKHLFIMCELDQKKILLLVQKILGENVTEPTVERNKTFWPAGIIHLRAQKLALFGLFEETDTSYLHFRVDK